MGKRVLVVEDDRNVRDYLAAAIESSLSDVEVLVASNGREAAERVAAAPVELVLTDLNMPEMNGIELVRALRTSHPAVRVVLMSGASADWLADLRREGLDELPLLTKPVSVSHLVGLVSALLGD